MLRWSLDHVCCVTPTATQLSGRQLCRMQRGCVVAGDSVFPVRGCAAVCDRDRPCATSRHTSVLLHLLLIVTVAHPLLTADQLLSWIISVSSAMLVDRS